MQIVLLIIRLGFALLFISTGFSKILKVEEHIAIVKEYRIIPNRYSRLFAEFEILIEIIIGISLLIGIFQKWISILSIGMLIIYTTAMIKNILQGRTVISCGCGGLAGNHLLSWKLILRNIILILFSICLIKYRSVIGSIDSVFQGETWSDVFSFIYFLFIFLLVSTSTFIFLNLEAVKIKKHMKELLYIKEEQK